MSTNSSSTNNSSTNSAGSRANINLKRTYLNYSLTHMRVMLRGGQTIPLFGSYGGGITGGGTNQTGGGLTNNAVGQTNGGWWSQWVKLRGGISTNGYARSRWLGGGTNNAVASTNNAGVNNGYSRGSGVTVRTNAYPQQQTQQQTQQGTP